MFEFEDGDRNVDCFPRDYAGKGVSRQSPSCEGVLMNARAAIHMEEPPLAIEARATPPMRDYQLRAFLALLAGILYLALEQGLGKTRILIEYARAIRARRIVIVCPSSVVMVWLSEFAKWWPDGPRVFVCKGGLSELSEEGGAYPVDTGDGRRGYSTDPGVWVLTYDGMSRGFSPSLLDEIPAAPVFDLAICDEAHFLKNPKAARTKAVLSGLRRMVKRMVAASGTPAPNHYGEVFSSIRALAPDLIRLPNGRVMTQEQFEDLYCVVVTKFFHGRAVRQIVGSKNAEKFRELLKGFMLRMRKREVLPELLPLDMVTVPIEPLMHGIDVEQIRAAGDILSAGMDDDEVLQAFQAPDENASRLRAALGIAKASPASEFITDFLSDSKKKVVVWAEHHAVIDLLAERLSAFRPVVVDGRTPVRLREVAVQAFLNDPATRVFIGNIVAAGTGLTLVGPNCDCSDAFFVESSYTPGNNLQAAARIHRLGQRDGVLARVFTAAGTIDDRIQSIITRKSKDLAAIFDDKGD